MVSVLVPIERIQRNNAMLVKLEEDVVIGGLDDVLPRGPTILET